MPYLLDTNVFIQSKNLYYGFDFCPVFWDWLDRGNKSHIVFSIEKVRDELIAGDDELADWAKQRGADFFLPPSTSTLPSLELISEWAKNSKYEPSAVNTFLQVADYYLVAQAHAERFTVVTHEVVSNSLKIIKIHNACISHNLKVMSPYEMLRAEKARFVLA